MKTAPRLIAPFLALALVAAACGGDDDATTTTTGGEPPATAAPPTTDPPVTGALVKADVPRATATDITAADLSDLVAGNTEFAFDLFHAAAATGGNTLLSPYSVAAALTMTYAGARGDTAAEIRDALSLELSDELIHAARNELDLRIAAEPAPIRDDDREPFAIRVANSLWGQQGYPILEEFLVLLAESYDAGMNLVDFINETEQARRTINGWVEGRTEGRIVDLIPQGVLTDLTRLVLVNAIWFKANWAEQFDPMLTDDASFTTLDGDRVTVPMMHGNFRLPYAAGDGFQTVRLPYAGDASMLLIVPDQGRFDEVAVAFGSADLASIRDATSEHQVEIALPKFEFRSEFTLQQALEDLGMAAAFTEPSRPGGADFTGITQRRELFVHEVVHQAFITVDEQGTEAAAATAVIIGEEWAAPPATLTIDRPFLFLIEHDSTGEILFIGRVADPS